MRRPDAEQGVVLRAADDGDDGLRRRGLQDRRAVPRQGRKDPQPPPPPSGELIVHVQGTAKRRTPGLVTFVPAVAYHSSLPALPLVALVADTAAPGSHSL